MNVHLHIERLVVDGSVAVDRQTLEAALAAGLAGGIEGGRLPLALLASAEIRRLDGTAPQAAGSVRAYGEEIGRSLHDVLAGGSFEFARSRGRR